LSDFERGHLVGARLAGASVTKAATLLGVSRATVSKVMSEFMNYGKTSARRNSGRKSTMTETDRRTLRRIVSKNHRTTTAQVRVELDIHLEDPISTKTVRHEFHKCNINSRAAIAKPLVTESNAQMRKRWCHGKKIWTSDNRKLARDMIRRVVLHAVPYMTKSLCLENTQESLQYGKPCSVPTVKHEEIL
jgi:transposase